ncbi:hypothetical protein BS47DRAFT_1487014 [Hydnum rufescens UP504]|uniref:Small ribosomal subunit protein uS10 domain-containing protein n=1 Tax=Hydnum rufescens UP504 TaxID=1448309 RepID=A0A9P6DUZ6_9AGAM|nr:hypothetical protein BS47DRAFT_1487014 [Hydnum rufescens UP504]
MLLAVKTTATTEIPFISSLVACRLSPKFVERMAKSNRSYRPEELDSYSPLAALTISPRRRWTRGTPVAMVRLQSHTPGSRSPRGTPLNYGRQSRMRNLENFEKVVHKRAIKVWHSHSEVLRKWIKYLEINLGGVGMRIIQQLADNIIHTEMEAITLAGDTGQKPDEKMTTTMSGQPFSSTPLSSLNSDLSERPTIAAAAREKSAEADIKH